MRQLLAMVCAVLCLWNSKPLRAQENRPLIQSFHLAEQDVVDVQGTMSSFRSDNKTFLRWSAKEIGDTITFRLRLRPDSERRVYTTTYRTGREGIYELLANGQPVGAQHDLWASNVWEHGRYPVTGGVILLTYRLVGKNPKSEGIEVTFNNFTVGI